MKLSDLDVAYGVKMENGKLWRMTSDEINDWRDNVNRIYGVNVITHSDNISGRLPEINSPLAFKVPANTPTLLYSKRGLVGFGDYSDTLKQLLPGFNQQSIGLK